MNPSYRVRLCFQLVLLLPLLLAGASAAPDATPFPSAESKKGLQVQMLDDAIALGVKHAALNVNFANFLRVEEGPGCEALTVSNHTFFIKTQAFAGLDQQVAGLTQSGAIVSLILLYYKSDDPKLDELMLHPKFDPASPNRLSAFNTTNPRSAAALAACIEMLARRYSGANPQYGRVWNYIVGNEVNSHWHWHNMGHVSMEQFTREYHRAVRLVHGIVRKHSQQARVYLSLEHHWNIRYEGGNEEQTFAGRPFMELFARLTREEGDFDWHLAFHPYPENLFECRTWNDASARLDLETPRITFKNIQVLTTYMEREEMRFQGRPRRIILSEQGFHSVATPEGEALQAAAYAYAYKKIEPLAGIDSFILHRHVDHSHEGGLNLGLWSRKADSISTPERKKPIYSVFLHADQADWEEHFRFALPLIGIKKWEELNAGK
ncbi:MAG: DUF5722 domain-containing protein [Verrucomicrobiota bacterium]|nr:DUF5722 domain-containing protein [Verrucomicrobiota bacterium]